MLEDCTSAEANVLESAEFFSSNKIDGLSTEELQKKIRDDLCEFLTALEKDNDNGSANQLLIAWGGNKLELFNNNILSFTDIILLAFAQKKALLKFIPLFTKDVSIAVRIVEQLEEHYKAILNTANDLLVQLQKKDTDNEEKYRHLFDNTSDLIHMVSPEGNILYVNNAWKNALGYKNEELEGKSIYSFISDKDKENYRQYRQRVIAGEKLKEFETIFINKQGAEIILEGTVTCKYKNGQPEYTQGILRNITERRRADITLKFFNEELKEREENLSQLIHQAPDGIIVIDYNSKIILWNPKSEEIFGWKTEEVLGNTLTHTIIPSQHREAHSKGMQRLLSAGQSRILNKTVEITALNKKNEEFYISLTISQGRQKGEPVFIAFIRDISEQKRNELELENKRTQLEKTNKELEQYAWLTSHDLKEPLRKIRMYSDLLLTSNSSILPADASLYLKKIGGAAFRMDNLIEGILAYSNVSADHNLFKKVHLNTILGEVLSDLEATITAKNASVEAENLPVIEAIPVQMRQLFQNLISNAIKYTRPDIKPMVKINSIHIDDNNVAISVGDNGIGFENKYAEKIFQVFQRLGDKKEYEGTGIGLALCKKIAETHGGNIHAESELGIGSVFTVTLPVSHSKT